MMHFGLLVDGIGSYVLSVLCLVLAGTTRSMDSPDTATPLALILGALLWGANGSLALVTRQAVRELQARVAALEQKVGQQRGN